MPHKPESKAIKHACRHTAVPVLKYRGYGLRISQVWAEGCSYLVLHEREAKPRSLEAVMLGVPPRMRIRLHGVVPVKVRKLHSRQKALAELHAQAERMLGAKKARRARTVLSEALAA